jgi:hypothetical protein
VPLCGRRDRETFAHHLHVFPEGQLVAVDEKGILLGSASSLIIDWDDYAESAKWSAITGHGTFDTHNPLGESLYGADVSVDPLEPAVIPSGAGAPSARRSCASWGDGAGVPDGRRSCVRWGGGARNPPRFFSGAKWKWGSWAAPPLILVVFALATFASASQALVSRKSGPLG